MDEQITTLRFKAPGRDSRGYLARMRRALEFRRQLIGEPTPETLDALVRFLAEYVTEPAGMEQRIEALYQATQDEFETLLGALSGENGNPTG